MASYRHGMVEPRLYWGGGGGGGGQIQNLVEEGAQRSHALL